jgi:hypothetical protein
MSNQKNRDKIKCGEDAIRYATHHPNCRGVRTAGSHVTVDGPEGRATFANHKREWPPGLRRKVILELVAIGLGVLGLVVWLY